MLEDDPAMAKRFKHVDAVVQFVARNQPRAVGAYLWFENGDVRVEQGFWDADGLGREPDITFTFGSLEKLCDFFAGKTVLPGIRGYNHPALLAKVVRLLLSLKLMLPSAQPDRPGQTPPQGQAHRVHDHDRPEPVQQGRRPGHAALDGQAA